MFILTCYVEHERALLLCFGFVINRKTIRTGPEMRALGLAQSCDGSRWQASLLTSLPACKKAGNYNLPLAEVKVKRNSICLCSYSSLFTHSYGTN